MHRRLLLTTGALLVTAVVASCAAGGGQAAQVNASLDGAFILSLEDADAPPTALLDGSLVGREPHTSDTLTVVRLPLPGASPDSPAVSEYAQALTDSAFVDSPMSLSVSPDGAWAAIAASRAGAQAGRERLEDLAPLSRIALYDLRAWPPRLTDEATACREPASVDIHPEGGRLCAVSGATGELVILHVRAGRFREVVRIPVGRIFETEHAPTGAFWSPDGGTIAVCFGAGGVGFLGVDLSTIERPALSALGSLTPAGRFARLGAWTPDGAAFLALDTGWIDAERGMREPGQVGGAHLVVPGAGVAASVELPGEPHAIAISPDGSRALVTGLAKADPHEPDTTRRTGGTLTLLRVGRGSLESLDRTACGSLPMDVDFDATGRGAIVADFAEGRVEVFRVEGSRVVFTGLRVETNYGVHQARVVR